MEQLQKFEFLGPRIAIIGPSNSGKSTLAAGLGQALNIPVYHLDRMAHEKGTNWKRLPDSQLVAAHDEIVPRETWIIDGNYSICMKQRFARASAVIWLDPPLAGCILRYLARSIANRPDRVGGLEGAGREFNPALIKYTLVNYPQNKRKYRELLKEFPDLKVLVFKKLASLSDLRALQAEEGMPSITWEEK